MWYFLLKMFWVIINLNHICSLPTENYFETFFFFSILKIEIEDVNSETLKAQKPQG